MNEHAPLLAARRSVLFWLGSALAILLTLLSYFSRQLITSLNADIFSASAFDDRGGWLYVALRLPIVALLVWTILRFPDFKGARTASITKSRQPLFDPLMGLRALACFFVLIGHFFIVAFPFTEDHLHRSTIFLRCPPWAGVWIFFTLSGYLMGKAFLRQRYSLDEAGSKLFFRNRMLRIYPVYVFGVIVVSAYMYSDIFRLRHLWMLIEIFTFDYAGTTPIHPIGALWSVSTEAQFYLLVPAITVALLYIRKRLGKIFPLLPIGLLVAGTCARLWVQFHCPKEILYRIYEPFLPNLDIFVFGFSVNLIPAFTSINRRAAKLLLVLGVIGFYAFSCRALASLLGRHISPDYIFTVGPVVCSLFAAMFIWVAESAGKIPISRGPLGACLVAIQGIGTLTYCLYVFHSDVMLKNAELLPQSHSIHLSWLYFPSVMLQIFSISALFYFFVEKPFDIRKRVGVSALLDAP